MPCWQCGARQTDPGKTPSPWKVGVRASAQVLVCPDCQRDGHWLDALDSCATCGSTLLTRRLGATVCRACGATTGEGPVEMAGDAAAPRAADGSLSKDVAAALDRTFGREHG